MIRFLNKDEYFDIGNVTFLFEAKYSYKPECEPIVRISTSNADCNMQISLNFESIDKMKEFVKQLEEKIPLIEKWHKKHWEAHLKLNPDLKDKK